MSDKLTDEIIITLENLSPLGRNTVLFFGVACIHRARGDWLKAAGYYAGYLTLRGAVNLIFLTRYLMSGI